jgi:hypothetical protein
VNAVLALIAMGIFLAFILPFGLALAFFMGRLVWRLVGDVIGWWWEVCSAIAYADWFERKK